MCRNLDMGKKTNLASIEMPLLSISILTVIFFREIIKRELGKEKAS